MNAEKKLGYCSLCSKTGGKTYVSIFTNSKRDRKRNSGFARKSDRRGGSGRREGILGLEGHMGRAQVPSGASTGKFEALEKRDQEARYLGQGVRKAVEAVNTVLADAVVGENALEQERIDHILCQADGTETKENLGANAILGVSLAVARAAANALHLPLYQYLGGATQAVCPCR